MAIHLQADIENELKKLIEERHIKKLACCSEQLYISLIVIIVKLDKNIKLPLDSKVLNKAILKKK